MTSISASQRSEMPDSDKGFDMYHRKIETYICTKRNVFFDMATATMKSLKAGLNFTLKRGIFCPKNGEGLRLVKFIQ